MLCLGFLYHTLRYSELLHGIRALEPTYLVLDTAVYLNANRVVRLFAEDVERERSAADNPLAYGGRMLTGRPSIGALKVILDMYDFDVVKRFDWQTALDADPQVKSVNSYRAGRRVTWVARNRTLGS